ncbi:N-acetylglucosamine kinase [Polaribacter sargassicola]|uniref:N-acetylglucosamine kinase n=1 Tax=Polaribacter sargassicola TaxID=2836891 RepID=UPI001F17CE80|nr:N-acetylglucosamine kinase [Polaribacter sp. DS7-9]MCG1037151.1 N-acetylglucosamine kinase [Polaribacter sp. DS7-9]
MILIAESGSTKCDWVLLDTLNDKKLNTKTKGLNPAILKKKELKSIISDNDILLKYKKDIKKVYFFGAGCNTSKTKNNVHSVLNSFFENAISVVEEDTMAAVYATTSKPAVVCILGTGSNCCYYDGKSIINKSTSLGYIVMDEGSGNHFGKELLKSYYNKQMPKELRTLFENNYDLSGKTVIKKLYQSKTPNKYLASFAPFVFENKEHSFIETLINNVINLFIKNHILQYTDELKTVPLHFVGSIAFYGQEYISNQLKKQGLNAGKFIQKPIDGLIEFIKKENAITQY